MMGPRQRVQSTERIAVKKFFDDFSSKLNLSLIAGEQGLDRVIREKSINRPALVLTGYTKYFAYKRLQLFGAGEMGYLRELSKRRQVQVLESIIECGIPCMVVSRGLVPLPTMVDVANECNVPLFRTKMKSKDFSAEATILLEQHFAPPNQSTWHFNRCPWGRCPYPG